MFYRILHCGKSLRNYNLCIKHSVVGFNTRSPQKDDIIFLVVNYQKQPRCGLRAKLGEPTDQQPWPDAERYVSLYNLVDIEYANPFDIRFLADYGGQYWNLKFLQLAKVIKDEKAIQALNDTFNKNLSEKAKLFAETNPPGDNDDSDNTSQGISLNQVPQVLVEVLEAKINVMGTFQTISFKNETDALRGLEALVNENFYNFFPRYRPTHSLLLPENRLFLSSGVEARGEKVIKGIRSIPDAILIVYSEQKKQPFKIALIEYECFG